ncbi:unnamed protein product [Cyclocybe aegerita]|uniref:Uncharacterized protein n=1 Tax=Cyclocybe aegerita TaxID=1973307 RepID=A0A8S0X5A1_CYCAE|nr:unnamed protein product [Cyclocybe aegerita]
MRPIALPEMLPEGEDTVPTVAELFEPEDTLTDAGIGASGALPLGRAVLPDPLTSDSDGMALDPLPDPDLSDGTGVSPAIGCADLPDPLSLDSDGMGLEVPSINVDSKGDTKEDDSSNSDIGVPPAPEIIDLTRVDSSDVEDDGTDSNFSGVPAPEIIDLTHVDDDVVFEDDSGDDGQYEEGEFEDDDKANGEGGLGAQILMALFSGQFSAGHQETEDEPDGTSNTITLAVTQLLIPTVGPAAI